VKHCIEPERPDLRGVKCPVVEGSDSIGESHLIYLSDESRITGGTPNRIYFPRSTAETAEAIRDVASRSEHVTVSGGRTGIVGGAVPLDSENLLSTVELTTAPGVSYNGHFECWCVRAAAGVTLEELDEHLRNSPPEPGLRLFYPVDPTERSCSLGGNVAANASGARTLHYGPTRDWVLALTVVLADGGILRLTRGGVRAQNARFLLHDGSGGTREIPIPDIPMPRTKHVAGYYVREDMDLLDLFVGGEGTLGVVTEIDLRLEAEAREILYLSLFLPESKVLPVVRRLKSSLDPLALEYMDRRSLALLAAYKEEQGAASEVPSFPTDAEAVLYTELAGDLESIYESLAALLEEMEIDLQSSWSGSSRTDGEAMKAFRHALPERINSLIAARKAEIPELTKIGTDMAVPDEAVPEMLRTYRESLDSRGLEYCIFGHIGNGHLHVNILPENTRQLSAGRELYREFARKAVELGGSVAAEHGIGRLKREFLRIQYDEEEIRGMRRIKEILDPEGLLNPGVLF